MATDYVILKKEAGEHGRWKELAGVQAAGSSHAAIRTAMSKATEGGEFIAVPARSWQPVKVSIEKAVRLG